MFGGLRDPRNRITTAISWNKLSCVKHASHACQIIASVQALSSSVFLRILPYPDIQERAWIRLVSSDYYYYSTGNHEIIELCSVKLRYIPRTQEMPGLDSESTATTSPSNGARRLCSGAMPLRESQVTSESHRDEKDSGLRGKMRQFTSRELCRLNQLHNAHLAYRGKVGPFMVHAAMTSL